MSHPSLASLLDVDLQPGKPPLVRAGAGADAASWTAAHREALRAVVTEHGSALVRGLGLRDAAETSGVFQRLAVSLMPEKEAFAPREPHAGGLYSATPWPPNQQMCMHHELSYKLEFPGLMLFACLTAPASGGATTVSDSPTVLGDHGTQRVAVPSGPRGRIAMGFSLYHRGLARLKLHVRQGRQGRVRHVSVPSKWVRINQWVRTSTASAAWAGRVRRK